MKKTGLRYLKYSSSIWRKYIGFLFSVGIIFAATFYYTAIFRMPLKKVKIFLGEREYTILIAQTQAERERGLQYIRWLPKNMGMLFLFARPDAYCFWNKNTYVSLKLIFRRKEKIVQESYLSPISKGAMTVCAQEPVDSVIEVAAD